jgi:hypothetical protein
MVLVCERDDHERKECCAMAHVDIVFVKRDGAVGGVVG